MKDYKKYYDSREFKEQYVYDGSDLGAVCGEKETVFKLWSPLAEKVTLNLYRDGAGERCRFLVMEKKEKGVWACRIGGSCHGIYYDFTVEADGISVRTADPYAKACSCNGQRSMAVELKKTDPEGWEQDRRPGEKREQIIYEIHVKDFSHDPAGGVPEEYRGKYKAFTVEGTSLNGEGEKPTCLDYLKKLGITHVQLMPVFDFGSVNEEDPGEYNWGYDPVNFNVPEGAYSTDPFHGEVRIRELKELVMAMHRNGIGVIMDVVYNHTYQVDSWFSRTAPYYFYRQNEDGTYSNGSGCGNDLASEREMCGKYILESVLYWAEEYHMDGFRFDLMGLLDTELLNRIRQELDLRFGKDRVILYGEPWGAGSTPMRTGSMPCLKENICLLDARVGIFCDNTRDAIKGHVFYQEVPGFVNGGQDCERDILHGVRAWTDRADGWCAKAPSQIISYISAHDNLTLWDKLMVTLRPGEAFAERHEQVVRANKMAAAIYFTSQGRIFFLGGEEGARTKWGNDNSYNLPPGINQIDWKRVYEYEDLMTYYRGLIAFRKQMPGLWDKSAGAGKRIFAEEIPADGVVQFRVNNLCQLARESFYCSICRETNDAAPCGEDGWETLAVWYNAGSREQLLELPDGSWELLLDGESAWHWKSPVTVKGKQGIAPMEVKVFGKKIMDETMYREQDDEIHLRETKLEHQRAGGGKLLSADKRAGRFLSRHNVGS